MKRASRFAIFLLSLLMPIIGLAPVFNPSDTQQISAQTKNYSLDAVDVKIKVNKDSTMKVSEKLSYTFDDSMNGMFREITLSDEENNLRCKDNPNLQCGGFNFINIDKVYVNGKEIEKGRYEILDVDKIYEKRLRVQYKFDNAPVRLYNEKYTFQVDYTVLGGMGFFEDYDLFYWNALFADRDQTIKKGSVEIEYPGEVKLDSANSVVFSEAGKDYTYKQETPGVVKYTVENLAQQVEFTILQKLDKGLMEKPGSVKLQLDPAEQNVEFGQFNVPVKDGGSIEGLPAGEHKLTFSKSGYYEKSFDLTIKSGEAQDLQVTLKRTPFSWAVLITVIVCNICLCFLALAVPFGLYIWWRRKGRDAGPAKTTIPEFNPPKDMKPYLLGSLKDEKVDSTDISAAIIDLAYRGHLQIVEEPKKFLGKQDFTLNKKNGKDELDAIEQKIMDMFFSGGKDSVKLSSLKYKAYKDLKSINDSVYEEMVAQGYFKQNPQSVRNKWVGIGIVALVLGIGGSVLLSMIGIFTGFGLAVLGGIGLMIVGQVMPAKTASGSEALWMIRGFKMYLETAEKYTLQKLTPDRFERFLSYAMVFGVEKQWAEKFKDIYKGQPDWYQSQNNTFNTLLLANALGDFNSSASSTIKSTPSNSSSGGGWSGGGGFSGGFSGGGGGGGGGGAW